jgi:hypothetical protein
MAKWVIDSEDSLRKEWREKWGDEEFERRKRIADEKREQYPDSEWEAQIILGNQFESVAMQCSQEVFDKLAERDYKFWGCLVHKVATG